MDTAPAIMDTAPAIDLRSYGGELREHCHSHHQLVLALTGTLELDTRAGSRRADAATGVLIPAGERHAFRGRGPNRFAVVDVSGRADGAVFERAHREPAFVVSDGLRHHVAALVAHLAEGPVSPRFRYHWAALLIDALEATPGLRHPDAARFDAATRHVERHCHRRLPLAEIAAEAGVGVAALGALVRRYTGCTPAAWVRGLRLDRAARLLAGGDRAIADIALDCGFSEHSALTRAFRRVHGLSPSEYRRLHRCAPSRTAEHRPGSGP